MNTATVFETDHVESRKRTQVHQVGCGEEAGVVENFEAQKRVWSAEMDEVEEGRILGKRMRVEKERTRPHSQQSGQKMPRCEQSLHHAFAVAEAAPLAFLFCSLHLRNSWSRQRVFLTAELRTWSALLSMNFA